MSVRTFIYWQCPYCGQNNRNSIEVNLINDERLDAFFCAGCYTPCVVETKVAATHTVRKIEGVEQRIQPATPKPNDHPF